MDSKLSACSQGPIVEALDSSHYQTSLDAEALKDHPFWSSAKGEDFEKCPPYTDGRSRIVLANDDTKDCLALLLTPTLVAALNQITHDILALEKKDGALERIEAEITDLAIKATNVTEGITHPRHQDRKEEMQLALEILQLKQEDAKERKSKLSKGMLPYEISLRFARCQSQQIFEEALLEARLLDAPEQGSPLEFQDVDDDDDHDSDTLAEDSFDAPSMYEGTEPSPEQQLLREANLDVVASYDVLKNCRASFENRKADYDDKLAEFERSEMEMECTRTQFDHQHIQHVHVLTKDLISAEEAYRAAKAKARALELPPDAFDHLVVDETRRSEEEGTKPDRERERIEAWTRAVLPDQDVEALEEKQSLTFDDWNARPVEIMDSISVIDRDGYADEINDWKRHCGKLREELLSGKE